MRNPPQSPIVAQGHAASLLPPGPERASTPSMRVFLTGTDTGIGKTLAAAWLLLHSGARYWKPVQAGLDGETDEQTVRRLTGLGGDRFHPTVYSLNQPLSPHEAARRDGVAIAMDRFAVPDGPLVVEGAGGLMVPLNPESLVIDLIRQSGLPALLMARTALGTINHTLLSLEALRSRRIPVAGVLLCGPNMPHNRAAIESYGKARVVGHLPPLEPVTREALLAVEPECDLDSL